MSREWDWMEDKDEHCHYSGLPSPKAYEKDLDYDGMGNQGRVPEKTIKDDSKDWYLMLSVFAIGFITVLILISLMI